MVEDRETYKGKEIVITNEEETIRSARRKSKVTIPEAETKERELELLIDGELVSTTKDSVSGKYLTAIMPYQEFSSLREMARILIDNSPSSQ